MPILFLILLLWQSPQLRAQFFLSGDATDMGNNTFQLTPNTNWMSGSMWYQIRHDLTTDFTVSGQLFFGNNDDGADGMVFVMQDRCLGDGTQGGGMGYQGMTGNSIGIEFDIYQNGPGGNFDPAFDHIALHQFGNANHNAPDNLAGPVQMHVSKSDVEDSTWYSFQITYSASTNILDVYFDGTLRISHTIDLVNAVFDNNPFVYWGFTSATGGQNANHRVMIGGNTSLSFSDDTICTGSTTLQLPPIIPYNLAFNASISVSTVQQGGGTQYGPDKANDMEMASYWASQKNDNEWLVVDLGEIIPLDSVLIYWGQNYGLSYAIDVSTDSLQWTNLFTTSTGIGGKDAIAFARTDARFVRMQGIQRSNNFGYEINEIEVYGLREYAWTPNDGSINDTTSANPIFTPLTTTDYTLAIPDMCAGEVYYNYRVVVDCILLQEEAVLLNAVNAKKGILLSIHCQDVSSFQSIQLERSFDGIEFHTIHTDVLSSMDGISTYNWLDDQISDHIDGYYYRVRIVKKDQSKRYTPTSYIQLHKHPSALNIYPNPVSDQLHIYYPNAQLFEIAVFDQIGRCVLSNTMVNGPNYILPTKHLKKGLYSLVINKGHYVRMFKKG